MGGTKFQPNDPVIGFLFGIQDGLDISIIDATEAVYEMIDNRAELSKEKNVEKCELWTKVFSNHELLGWYTVGDTEPEQWCYPIHNGIKELNEAPLFLLMNRAPDPNSKQLPLIIFEGETTSLSATAFASVAFQLQTTQVERIAVDQIIKTAPSDGMSTLEVQNLTVVTSLRTIEEMIDILLAALQVMQQKGGPKEPSDYELLRRAAKICQQLPSIDSNIFNPGFSNEITDCMMVTYLGASTKTLSALAQLSEIFNQVFTQHSRKVRERAY